jgi:hypothetical protein
MRSSSAARCVNATHAKRRQQHMTTSVDVVLMLIVPVLMHKCCEG